MLLHKSNSKSSARRQIDIKSVKDGILQLTSHRYRLILQTSSVNFELKSEAEQDAIVDTYQSFLNSLTMPLQVIIRIREVDMDKYLANLSVRLAGESEDVYRKQLANYTEFVRGLITTNKILDRHFYVVVQYEDSKGADFDIAKEHLGLTSDIVARGLGRLGMATRQLTSLEVLDLFYSFYSPHQAKTQPITEQTLRLLGRSYL